MRGKNVDGMIICGVLFVMGLYFQIPVYLILIFGILFFYNLFKFFKNKNLNIKSKNSARMIENNNTKLINNNSEIIPKTNNNYLKNYVYPPISLLQKNDFRKGLTSIPVKDSKNTMLFLKEKNFKGEEPIFQSFNISKLPNLLIGGTLMSGKTTLINSIICSALMRQRPDRLKLLIFDSKKIEYIIYNGIPHLLAPVVTNSKRASVALKRIVAEMERRYDVFEESQTKNIESYNAYIDKENEELPEDQKERYMPNILVIIDDITIFSKEDKDFLNTIENLSKLGYTVGINIILVANHPSAEVISTIAQSNFPARISFKTTSKQDSRIILDENGAETLNDFGSCLCKNLNNSSKIMEYSLCSVSEEEIKALVEYVCNQQSVQYDEKMRATTMLNDGEDYEEPLYDEIVDFVVQQGKASASLLQRRFRLGYNRAARCIDLLEDRGIIGPQNGSKPREVLVKKEED